MKLFFQLNVDNEQPDEDSPGSEEDEKDAEQNGVEEKPSLAAPAEKHAAKNKNKKKKKKGKGETEKGKLTNVSKYC